MQWANSEDKIEYFIKINFDMKNILSKKEKENFKLIFVRYNKKYILLKNFSI